METSGTTLLLLLAAALWLVYLVPLWLKRSEYYATERNAARLGQTLRLLANTSEVSAEIKAELEARSIARKEREAQRQLRVMSSPVLTTAERRRRTKQVFSLLLLLGVTSAVTAYLAAWPLQVIWASSTISTISFAILGRLNRVTKAEAGAVAHARASAPVHVPVATETAWRPPALPEPLANKVATEATPLPSHDELVRAARAKALENRPEDFAGEGLAVVSQLESREEAPAKKLEKLNIDEVLRRRRAV
ncbi:MAG: hypothetical protein K9G03_03495 [Pontimonas sp.]|nr:hypothetical protein [Pontimonas sp.]